MVYSLLTDPYFNIFQQSFAIFDLFFWCILCFQKAGTGSSQETLSWPSAVQDGIGGGRFLGPTETISDGFGCFFNWWFMGVDILISECV